MTAQAFKQQILEHQPNENQNTWLAGWHRQASELLNRMNLPDRHVESWKYASLHALYQRDLSNIQRGGVATELGELAALEGLIIRADAEGQFQFSGPHQDGLTATTFSEANDQQQGIISQYLGNIAQQQKHPFTVVNAALMKDGLLIHVPANMQVTNPILIDTSQVDAHWNGRVLIVIEAGAKATVVERQTVVNPVWHNIVTEVNVAENAYFTHYRLSEPSIDSQLISSNHVAQYAHSNYAMHSFNQGSQLHRQDIHLRMLGEGGESLVNGVFSANLKDQTDIRLEVEHIAAHCNSTENFRGLAGGKGRCNFNGRIHIHPHAQKTSAMLSSKNILLSKSAEINAKPELEIYADDVKCAHGATVGQLDKEAVFYLRSRGVNDADAKALLSHGFANELVMAMPHYGIRDYLAPALASLYQVAAS